MLPLLVAVWRNPLDVPVSAAVEMVRPPTKKLPWDFSTSESANATPAAANTTRTMIVAVKYFLPFPVDRQLFITRHSFRTIGPTSPHLGQKKHLTQSAQRTQRKTRDRASFFFSSLFFSLLLASSLLCALCALCVKSSFPEHP